jgi:glycine cleavage system regulatory protein
MRALVERIGWPGIAGIGLNLFSLSFYVSQILPAQQAVDDLRKEKTQWQTTTQAVSPGASAPAATTLANSPLLLARISGLADENGIQIARMISQIEDTEGEQRLGIRLPIRAAYPALRTYLRALSSALPGLAFDEINLTRTHAGEETVEADIHISFRLLRST